MLARIYYSCQHHAQFLICIRDIETEYYFAHDTLNMAGLVLERINSDIHVQCYARFNLFAKSKQNGLNKTSITLKREVWELCSRMKTAEIFVATAKQSGLNKNCSLSKWEQLDRCCDCAL